jgi:hypothetical protein
MGKGDDVVDVDVGGLGEDLSGIGADPAPPRDVALFVPLELQGAEVVADEDLGPGGPRWRAPPRRRRGPDGAEGVPPMNNSSAPRPAAWARSGEDPRRRGIPSSASRPPRGLRSGRGAMGARRGGPFQVFI